LITNVLNQLADKANLESVDLVLLNFKLSAKESHDLMAFIAEKQVKKQVLSKKEFTDPVLKIKPDIESADGLVDQLKNAFVAEDRFPDVLNQ